MLPSVSTTRHTIYRDMTYQPRAVRSCACVSSWQCDAACGLVPRLRATQMAANGWPHCGLHVNMWFIWVYTTYNREIRVIPRAPPIKNAAEKLSYGRHTKFRVGGITLHHKLLLIFLNRARYQNVALDPGYTSHHIPWHDLPAHGRQIVRMHPHLALYCSVRACTEVSCDANGCKRLVTLWATRWYIVCMGLYRLRQRSGLYREPPSFGIKRRYKTAV